MFIHMRCFSVSKGRYESESTLTKFKNLFLQTQLANFNHTWHKAYFNEGEASLFNSRAKSLSKGR